LPSSQVVQRSGGAHHWRHCGASRGLLPDVVTMAVGEGQGGWP
jgi:hypothetical protein